MSTLLHRILDQGKEEGTQITLRKTAQKMLQQGIDISIIQTVTDLPKEEILALQKQE